MGEIAIRVERLSKKYHIGAREEQYKTLRETLTRSATSAFKRLGSLVRGSSSVAERYIWALKDASFEIKRGDIVGIVGRNGAGKSTLLKVLSRITEPTEGYADVYGRVGSLLEVGTGFHPELTGRENVYLNGAILGMKKSDIQRKFDEIVSFSEVEKFIDTPVKHFSSGMHMRLAFAVAAHLEPEILMIDEVLAVGDVLFQKKCLGKMGDVAREGRTVLFVSHNMGAVRSLCNKGIFLHEGEVRNLGEVSESIQAYFKAIGALQGVEGDALAHGNGSRPCFSPILLNGAPGSAALQSDEFELATRLNITDSISGFSLYCILEDMQGRRIFCLREHNRALGCDATPAGEYRIRVKLPALWLNPGLYSVYFRVEFWGRYGPAQYFSDKFPLDIDGISSLKESILHPRASWSVHTMSGSS